ncbi:MAG: acetylxylan esterase [Verrucomicrobiales bacterium]|nr:acetylxylan esterase [Verrucomicrobiales bacterium]
MADKCHLVLRMGAGALVVFGLAFPSVPGGQFSVAVGAATRDPTLAQLQRILPDSPEWNDWLDRTGEGPPRFSAVSVGFAGTPTPAGVGADPSVPSGHAAEELLCRPALTDTFLRDFPPVADGESLAGWRQTTIATFEHFVFGSCPKERPSWCLESHDASVRWPRADRRIRLQSASRPDLRIELELRESRRSAPAPTVIWCGGTEPPEAIGESGRAVCRLVPADGETGARWWEAGSWMGADWGRLAREAWLIAGVADWVQSDASFTASREVVLAGEAWGGKVALWAAAINPRISAVLAADSGPGGACPFRLWTEADFGEGIELLTRRHPDWFHPRLRFFVGRETHLPVDAADLLALLAPRPGLVATATANPGESAWAVEQAWRAAVSVYRKSGREGALGLDIRSGGKPPDATDWLRWLEWLDDRLSADGTAASAPCRTENRGGITGPRFPDGRGSAPAAGDQTATSPATTMPAGALLRDALGNPVDSPSAWMSKRAGLRQTIQGLLGDSTLLPGARIPPASLATGGVERGPVPDWLHREPLVIREGVSGVIVHRTNILGTTRRLPAMIWLHPWSVPTGYAAAATRAEQPWLALARSGSVVLTFDQIGCGTRVEEAVEFYRQRPAGSLLGRMVEDTRAAITALAAHPHVDPEQVFLIGGGLGGAVALHVSALDDRVAGVICVNGFTPFRSDPPESGRGALVRWAASPPLLPWLAAFSGNESLLPYDFEELLAMTAPRPCLVVASMLDPRTSLPGIRAGIENARSVYALLGAAQALVLQEKEDYVHFTPDAIWCLCNDPAQR